MYWFCDSEKVYIHVYFFWAKVTTVFIFDFTIPIWKSVNNYLGESSKSFKWNRKLVTCWHTCRYYPKSFHLHDSAEFISDPESLKFIFYSLCYTQKDKSKSPYWCQSSCTLYIEHAAMVHPGFWNKLRCHKYWNYVHIQCSTHGINLFAI